MTEAKPAMADRQIAIAPLTGGAGAEVCGVDLRAADDDALAAIQQALFTYGVVVLRDQKLDNAAHIALAKRFGALDVHPIVEGMEGCPEVIKMHKRAGESASFGVGWHSDNSFMEAPSMGSIVRAEVVPPYGGDTLFANQMAAYEALSPAMQALLEGLRGIHSARDAYTTPTALQKYDGDTAIAYRQADIIEQTVDHPLVRTHPVTGRKALYANPMFTLGISGLADAEARAILEFLFDHATRPEFQCRLRWYPGSVAMWDNRLVMHNALDDYQDFERILYRVTVQGDRPV